jgi:hypothetical protein
LNFILIIIMAKEEALRKALNRRVKEAHLSCREEKSGSSLCWGHPGTPTVVDQTQQV